MYLLVQEGREGGDVTFTVVEMEMAATGHSLLTSIMDTYNTYILLLLAYDLGVGVYIHTHAAQQQQQQVVNTERGGGVCCCLLSPLKGSNGSFYFLLVSTLFFLALTRHLL